MIEKHLYRFDYTAETFYVALGSAGEERMPVEEAIARYKQLIKSHHTDPEVQSASYVAKVLVEENHGT